jgi:N-acetylglucosaminyldiphosphoundecaprenol N-acetyl-beta-D-mannosaminyltransferase
MTETVDRVVWMASQTDRPRHVCTGNLDHLVLLEKDPSFRAAYDAADLIVADGMPIVWLSRGRDRKPLRERVTGSDLFWELGHASEREGLRLFFLGGVPGSASLAADAVRARYPHAQIVGTYCPAFETFHTDQEQQAIADEIARARPDILLVGLGAPKQEKWIVENKERLGVPVSIGVGGTFEMASGIQRRAPRWMQRTGLEWCYRMLRDPKRLVRRYLGQDLPFLFTLLARNARQTDDYMGRLRRGSRGAL